MTIDYQPFQKLAEKTSLQPWAEELTRQSQEVFDHCRHGHFSMWRNALNKLPELKLSSLDLNADTVRAGLPEDCKEQTRQLLYDCFQKLRPWRKGPFNICGQQIDTEWRSDWKWNRLKNHIKPLKDKVVLDIGCGSGYHCWRMAGAGAALTVGIEPYLVFVMQYWAMRHFFGEQPMFVLPLGIEKLPAQMNAFDTIFSMGVLYHRKSPMDHLLHIRDLLKPGGELVLETLVIDGGSSEVLVPAGRYAKMRNVWFIPSPAALELWLRKCGFKNVRTVDITATTVDEQRTTDWMQWESLKEYLHPDSPDLTLEGYPAPKRAITLAEIH